MKERIRKWSKKAVKRKTPFSDTYVGRLQQLCGTHDMACTQH
jgi:hypothetical protein